MPAGRRDAPTFGEVVETHTCQGQGDLTGAIKYLGHGSTPSSGLKAGRVTDSTALARALKMALDEVRHLAGAPIQDIVVSVAGAQLAPIDRHGQVRLDSGQSISQREVERAIESAVGEDPEGLRTVHRVVQGFAVNGERTNAPLGRFGNDLDVWIRDFAVTSALVEGIREAAGNASTRVQPPISIWKRRSSARN